MIGTGAKACACSMAFCHASLAAMVTAATSSLDAPALGEPATQGPAQRAERLGVGRQREPGAGTEIRLGAHEQRRDVIVTAGWTQAAVEHAIAQRLDARGRAAGDRAEQALQTAVDALAAALDEAVRVEHQGGAGRERRDRLGVPGQVADARAGARRPSRIRGAPRSGSSSGGGCPALTNRSRSRSGSITA